MLKKRYKHGFLVKQDRFLTGFMTAANLLKFFPADLLKTALGITS